MSDQVNVLINQTKKFVGHTSQSVTYLTGSLWYLLCMSKCVVVGACRISFAVDKYCSQRLIVICRSAHKLSLFSNFSNC